MNEWKTLKLVSWIHNTFSLWKKTYQQFSFLTLLMTCPSLFTHWKSLMVIKTGWFNLLVLIRPDINRQIGIRGVSNSLNYILSTSDYMGSITILSLSDINIWYICTGLSLFFFFSSAGIGGLQPKVGPNPLTCLSLLCCHATDMSKTAS